MDAANDKASDATITRAYLEVILSPARKWNLGAAKTIGAGGRTAISALTLSAWTETLETNDESIDERGTLLDGAAGLRVV